MISASKTQITYQCDGVTTQFSFPYAYYDKSHVIGFLIDGAGKETKITTNCDFDDVNKKFIYPVSGTAIAAPNKIKLKRVTELSQLLDLPDEYPYGNVEKAQDKLTMIMQEANRLFDLTPAEFEDLVVSTKNNSIEAEQAREAAEGAQANAEISAAIVSGFLDGTGTAKTADLITKGPWVDVRAFGAVGDGVTDDTAAIQAAIDSLAGSTTPFVFYAKGIYDIPLGYLYIPKGVYKTTAAIQFPEPINVKCDGVLAGEVTIGKATPTTYNFYSTFKGLTCNSITIYPAYQCSFSDIKVTYHIMMAAANGLGLQYNTFNNIACNRLILRVTDGWINQNTFNNVTAFGSSSTYGLSVEGAAGIGAGDCQGNTFRDIDCSYGMGIINQTAANQINLIEGLYIEGGTGQTIKGNWNVVQAVLPYAGTSTPIRDTWENSLLFTYGGRSGEHLSMSCQNKALGGNWDVMHYGAMNCITSTPAGKMTLVTEPYNPAGTEMAMAGNFTVGQAVIINVGKYPAGYMNVAILYKGGVNNKIQVAVAIDGTDVMEEFDLVGADVGNEWKILRISRPVATNKDYCIIIYPGSYFAVGGVVASSGKIVGLPTASPVCREVVTTTQGTLTTGSEVDITVPIHAHFTYVTNFNYTIKDSGAGNTQNLVAHYLKSTSPTSAVVHVKYTAPFSCIIEGEAFGTIK